MKREYKRDLQNNYLVLKGGNEVQEYCVRMAEQNTVPGLLQFHRLARDGSWYLHFEITGLQPVSTIFEKRQLSYEDIIFILNSINDLLVMLQRYLLNPEWIVFDAACLFMEPGGRKLQFCYAPGIEETTSIQDLAEFILKRLDHQDADAVAVGYGFYQKTQEENFSLQKSLQEILKEAQEAEPPLDITQSVHEPEGRPEYPEDSTMRRDYDGTYEFAGRETMDGRQGELPDQDEYYVEHKERHKQGEGVAAKLFDMVHPAVLISTLFLLAVLEIVFYYGYLQLMEAGGIFFLILAVEILVNNAWKNHRKIKQKEQNARWAEEEYEQEAEELRKLQQEMYVMEEENEVIEKTCFLSEDMRKSKTGVHLVFKNTNVGGQQREAGYPNIWLDHRSLIIGKIKGQCDVLLESQTVSRIHARLEGSQGVWYVKDLNSRNGTFLNGVRLKPQEQKEFKPGDRIAFAELEYEVTL